MTLRLNGSTSGYVEIDAPATAGSNTLTLPDGNGSSGQVLSTDGAGGLSFVDRMTAAGPAFSASGTTQFLSASVTTKVVLATEYFDTANCYDTSTSRFTPNVAGYYLISAAAQYVDATTGGLLILKLDFNGSQRELAVHSGLNQYIRENVQFLHYMNGTTDYVEFYVAQTATESRYIGSTYFQGFLVRPA
jgi:hypothetical protein